MTDFVFIISIVNYNKLIEDISSWNEFGAFKDRHGNVEILVCDNSVAEIAEKNKAIAKSNGTIVKECADSDSDTIISSNSLTLISNNGANLGLSINYNKMIEYANSLNKDYWLFWSDDDTVFSIEYLENVYQAILDGGFDLISGVIDSMSPLRRHDTWAFERDFIVSSGEYSNIFCINSGLAIHKNILDQLVKYDERLFLDMIDYWLMDWLIEHKINRILIVDGEIHQTFSAQSDTDIDKIKRRFEIFKNDFSKYCELTGKSWLFKTVILGRRRLVIGLTELGIIGR